MSYYNQKTTAKRLLRKKLAAVVVIALLLVAGIGVYITLDRSDSTLLGDDAPRLLFDDSMTDQEQAKIEQVYQAIDFEGTLNVSATTTLQLSSTPALLEAYVPVSTFGSVRQAVTTGELSEISALPVVGSGDEQVLGYIADQLEIAPEKLTLLAAETELVDEQIALLPASQLSAEYKLLQLDGSYYLDDFTTGGVFREAIINGRKGLVPLMTPLGDEDVYSVNMTGVTALTRVMQRKLASVQDPLYFSANIGEFLADADLTHVSNEVSFKEDCAYSDFLFCSPPEFIETLKASGVDLVELTGNHNNDRGSEINTQTIEQYRALGWDTVGGGLNTADAAKPFVAREKQSKITFLAYNYPDSPNGGAIAGTDRAGANSYEIERIEQEITTAKESSDFVIVNVQYWECYSYPDGYVEYPICDKPIDRQEEVFKELVDLGADMVIGSSAHQPQTYELYKGKPIYYGLGNLYFDQTQWPGTERGIVLTHYFAKGKLLQTKLTPTVYGRDLQTRVMTSEEAAYLLTRLQSAR